MGMFGCPRALAPSSLWRSTRYAAMGQLGGVNFPASNCRSKRSDPSTWLVIEDSRSKHKGSFSQQRCILKVPAHYRSRSGQGRGRAVWNMFIHWGSQFRIPKLPEVVKSFGGSGVFGCIAQFRTHDVVVRLLGILGVSSCKARCEGITCTVEALSGSRMKTCFRLTGAWKQAPGNRFLELGSGKVLGQVLWEQGLAF